MSKKTPVDLSLGGLLALHLLGWWQWQHVKGAGHWQPALLGIQGASRDLLGFVLQSRPSALSTLFFDTVTDLWTFTSGSSFSGNLWTFMDIYFLVQASITLYKAKDHRDQLWSPGWIQGPILQGLSLFSACCRGQDHLLGFSSKWGDLCRGVGEALITGDAAPIFLSTKLSQFYWDLNSER